MSLRTEGATVPMKREVQSNVEKPEAGGNIVDEI